MGATWRLFIFAILVCAISLQSLQERPQPAVAPYWSEWNSIMKKMHLEMASVDSSGSSDADFVKLMLPHHQAAVDMARTELMYGKDPAIRRLAQEIITDQQSEIQLMQLWQTQHGAQK